MRTAPVTTGKDGADRIRDESGTYVARYRDGDGLSSKSRPGAGTRPRLKAFSPTWSGRPSECGPGLLTPAEARTAEHLATPIGEHVDAYVNSLEASGAAEARRRNDASASIGSPKLATSTPRRPEPASARAMAQQRDEERASARTRNVDLLRSSSSPTGAPIRALGGSRPTHFRGFPKADEKADPRRTPPGDDRSRACALCSTSPAADPCSMP